VLAAGIVLPASGCDDSTPAHPRACGTKELYGKKLELHVVGKRIPCDQVRTIVRGKCRDGRVWSCFAFRPPDPALVWFREKERFRPHWSTAIEARRYPCAKAKVTREAWTRAMHGSPEAFPTELQILADDLVRCKQLRGMTYREVRQLLGRGGTSSDNGKRVLHFGIGNERDSFFQVDSESLVIEFGRDGIFRSIGFGQS
jgi:hypothetical protein